MAQFAVCYLRLPGKGRLSAIVYQGSEPRLILTPQDLKDLKKCQTYAEKKICYEQNEVADMKSFDKRGW